MGCSSLIIAALTPCSKFYKMLKRKTLLSCLRAPLEFISHSLAGSKLTLLLFSMLFFSSMVSHAGEVSLSFRIGYIGTVGQNTGKADNIKTFTTLGIARVSFIQNDANGDGKFGDAGTQGNDLAGTIKFYLNSGQTFSVPGALNWREGTTEVYGIIFDAGVNQSFTYGNNLTFTVRGGTTNGTSSNLGLRLYASTVTFIDGEDRAGNAATSGLLDALNDELLNTPQPSTITNPTVVEGNNLVYSVTLSRATTASVPQVYTFTKSGTATSSGDYTPTFTFSNGVTDNGDGTLTVPGGVSSFTITASTIDDVTPEPTETLILNVGSKSGTGSITDNDVSLSTSVASLTAFSTCTGSASSAQSFTFSGNIHSGTVTVTAPSGFEISQTQNGTYTASIAYSFGSTTVSATTVWVRSKSNATSGSGNVTVATTGGTTQNVAVSVTVNAIPTITISPSSATIALGGSVTLIASGGSTYSWSPSTNLSASNTVSVTASPSSTISYTVTGTSAAGCSSTAVVTVTVNPALTAGSIATSQTICVGATPSTLTSSSAASGGVGTINYQWETSTDNTTWSDVVNATSSTYSPGAISVNTYFRRKASTFSDAPVYTSAVLISVQQSVGGSISGSATVCSGTNSTILTLSGETGSITKWQSSLTSNFSSVTDIASTTTSITATNLTATTYYRAIVTLGSCTAVNSSVATVTVNPLPTVSVNVIPDVNTSATSFSIPYANLSVGADQYSLTTGNTALVNFVAVSNASITTSPLTISIPASAQNSYDFNLTVRNSTTGCTSAVVPFILSVTDITPGTLSGDQSICYGTAPATITSATEAGVGSPTYIWQISTNGHSGTYTDIAGATSASYTHPVALTATTHFRRKATIGSSFAITHPVEVLVNALPVISISPSSATITTGSSVSLTASGANTYSWTPSSGLSATNTAVVTASPTATTTYTVTGTNSTTTCSSTATVSVTVNAALTAGSISADQTICVGATPASLSSATDASGGTGSFVYVWQSSINGTTFNTISGANSSTYSPGAISVNNYFRRGVSTATDAVVYTSAILITVQESVGGSITGSAAVCAGTNSTVLTLSGQTGSITKWQSALVANFSGTVTDIASTTASITATNLTATTYYRAVITLGSCSAVNSSIATVTVNALPVISVSPSAPSITSGANVSLTASGANTYSWTPSNGLPATNTAVVTASPTLTTTYTITGTSNTSCSGTTSVTVTVTSAAPADTDGDGVTDTQEIADGTDPNDGCSYVAASKTLTPSIAWNALDCDGDGTPNGTDTAPKDPCVHAAGATPVTTNAIWRAADCDGDGVTNGKESDDGTDSNDGCSYVAASKTLTPSSAWNSTDCDGDGTPNGTDTDPKDPCVHAAGATPVTTNAIWRAADCDGDGVTNGKETDDGTDPNDGCSYVAASKTLTPTTAWNALDCDGDGTPNGTDTDPNDPCVHLAGATPVTTNAIWLAADCDGDGVTNGKETDDGTDPNEGCSYVVASRTLTPSTAWGTLDCDADGNSNATDPNIDTPVASNDLVNLPSSGVSTVNILTNDDFLPGTNTEISRQLPPNDGTAKGTVTFNPLTGEMTYKRAPFETGLVTMGYKVTNKAVSPPVSALAFVTILACDLQDPLSDCDGDGEPNGTDLAPTDPCVYEPTRQVKANVSDDWKALDCDGDGVLNGTELADGTSPSDACSFKAGSITMAPSAAWLLLDCDADGVTNQVEGTQDLDGDGIPNCLDTDSDGDSISDKLETIVDTDRDGKPDYLDLDSDNDGILDSVENKVCTGTGILCDTDADGTPNFRDLDSDADQIKDVIEASGSDYNQDGIADGNIDEKGIPSSANKGLTPPDTDRDGKLDPYDVDSDGDGILDFDEEFNEDADFADCDKDGIVNRLDPDECEIFAPQGISPNGDGKNDRLVFKGLFLRKIPNHLSIFNRWGTLVFEMESYDNSFTGTVLPDGTYYYVLDFFGKKPTISNYLSVDRTIK